MFALKAMTIEGTLTGTLAEARELLDLVHEKKIAPIPTHDRPLGEAQAALDDLREGRVVGRTVLTV
jgi:alcohol dehydrogenase/propanol-preferring alcohol dehydrogenase